MFLVTIVTQKSWRFSGCFSHKRKDSDRVATLVIWFVVAQQGEKALEKRKKKIGELWRRQWLLKIEGGKTVLLMSDGVPPYFFFRWLLGAKNLMAVYTMHHISPKKQQIHLWLILPAKDSLCVSGMIEGFPVVIDKSTFGQDIRLNRHAIFRSGVGQQPQGVGAPLQFTLGAPSTFVSGSVAVRPALFCSWQSERLDRSFLASTSSRQCVSECLLTVSLINSTDYHSPWVCMCEWVCVWRFCVNWKPVDRWIRKLHATTALLLFRATTRREPHHEEIAKYGSIFCLFYSPPCAFSNGSGYTLFLLLLGRGCNQQRQPVSFKTVAICNQHPWGLVSRWCVLVHEAYYYDYAKRNPKSPLKTIISFPSFSWSL